MYRFLLGIVIAAGLGAASLHARAAPHDACNLALSQHPHDEDFHEFLHRPEVSVLAGFVADPARGAVYLRQYYEGLLRMRGEYSPHEVEIDFSDSVLQLLTTTDGTLGPLYAMVPQKFWPAGSSPETEWESISLRQQRDWIRALLHDRKPDHFFQPGGRKIPGMKVRDKIRLHFAEATNFLGVDYAAGTTVELESSFLEKDVEVRSPLDYLDHPDGPGGVELHLKMVNGKPSQLAEWSWAFQRALGAEYPYSHAHRLVYINPELFNADQVLYRLGMAEFILRINQYLELELVARGESLSDSKSQIPRDPQADGTPSEDLRWTNFSPLHTSQMFHFTRALLSGQPELVNTPGYRIKAFVGMTWLGFYRNKGAWGVEMRTLEPALADVILPLLDRLPQLLEDPGFGYELGIMQQWRELFHLKREINNLQDVDQYAQALSSLSFGGMVSELSLQGVFPEGYQAPPGQKVWLDNLYEFKRMEGAVAHFEIRPAIMQLYGRHQELGILFKLPDLWRRHPAVLLGRVDLEHLAKIQKSHMQELVKLIDEASRGSADLIYTPELGQKITALVSRYVRASGLLPAFRSSFGLR